MRKRYYAGGLIIFIIILVDQITKLIISKSFNIGDNLTVIKNFFYLTYYKNTGAAFGILNENIIFLIFISLLILSYLIYEMKKNINNKYMFYSFIVLIGGLIGNLIDRVFLGYVRDFFEFKIFNYNAPIFNVGDACITLGVISLIFFIFMEEKNGNNSKKRAE